MLRLGLCCGDLVHMIDFCNGVVAVNKITAVDVISIAWLGVALKLYGSALERGLFVCLFVIFIVIRYSFLCFAIYWFLSQLVCGYDGYSGNFSPLLRSRILGSYYCG
jgi:hypothetical protein